MARNLIESLGMPGLPLIVIPHPLGGLKPEEVKQKADIVVKEIISLLSQ